MSTKKIECLRGRQLLPKLHLRSAHTARLSTSLAVVVSAFFLGCSGTSDETTLPPSLVPASIAPLAEQPAQASLRVRIYVGADHRARVIGWEPELLAVVENASAMLVRGSSVSIDLVESVGWPRSGGPLGNTLAALMASDPGLDVDVVIGLVDAIESAETSFASLVATNSDARHIVIRGFSWQAEGAALGPAAEDLSESARDRLLIARRQHKQSIMLAHGIAELFGEPQALGSAYAMRTEALEPQAASRLTAQVLATLAIRKEAASRRPVVPEAGALRLIDTETLAQVQLLLEADKPGVAWEILEPLLELYPENPEIAVMGCEVAAARAATDIGARCENAVRLGSEAPSAHLALAKSLIAQEGRTSITNSSAQKAAKHLALAEGGLSPKALEWGEVAAAYQTLSLATHAARAARLSGDMVRVATWSRERIARFGVQIALAPDEEGRYLRAFEAGLVHAYAGNVAKTEAAAKSVAKNFPGSIGANLLRCELHMHKRRYSEALRECGTVIALHPANSWARYLQGVAHARSKRETEAIRLLREAIDNDVTLEPAYKALAQLYRSRSDARLQLLRNSFKKTFGRPL